MHFSNDAHPLGCTEQRDRDAETEREVIHWTSLSSCTLHPHPNATLGTDAVNCVVQLLLGCTAVLHPTSIGMHRDRDGIGMHSRDRDAVYCVVQRVLQYWDE